MKKLLILLLAFTSVCGVASLDKVAANAAAKKTVFLDEQFEETSFSSNKWKIDTAAESMELSCQEETGHLSIEGNCGVETYHLGTTKKVQGMEYMQFDFMMIGDWVGLNLSGAPLEIAGETFADTYSLEIAITKDGVCKFNDATTTVEKGYKFQNEEWYTMKIVAESASSAKLYVALQGAEDVVAESVLETTVLIKSGADYTFEAFYPYFSCEHGSSLALDNLTIAESLLRKCDNYSDIVKAIKDIKAEMIVRGR